MRDALRKLGLAGVGVAVMAASASPAGAADVTSPRVVKEVKAVAASTSAGLTVRFADGLYDAQDGDVYVDGNPDAVWRLNGSQLVPAPTSGQQLGALPGTVQPMESCGFVTYFHCEHTIVTPGCQPTTFWLNYVGDDFRDPYGSTLTPPEQVSIRDEPYRRYGVRGLRAYHSGKYGFYSVNCVTPN